MEHSSTLDLTRCIGLLGTISYSYFREAPLFLQSELHGIAMHYILHPEADVYLPNRRGGEGDPGVCACF
jgi:hypothetical protein